MTEADHPTAAAEAGGNVPGLVQRGGFYNRHSLPQHEAARFAEPSLRQAAEQVPLPPAGRPVVIADYGAAQGLTRWTRCVWQ